MLKALKELNSYSATEMSQLVSIILDKGLRQQILDQLEIRSSTPSFLSAMESEISYDLGDNDPKETTEDMLDHDLDIMDPQHEAKAEAAATDEYLFGGDVRAAKRKKVLNSRGKVSAMKENENENSVF